jgi:magnesium chelatase subunit I
VVSNAERRALVNHESPVVPRVSDIYASLPSITGKIELEYEGELKGAETVARDLVRAAVAAVFEGRTTGINTKPVITWFENGGTLDLTDTTSAADLLAARSASRRPNGRPWRTSSWRACRR